MHIASFDTVHSAQRLILTNNLATYIGDADVVNQVLGPEFTCTVAGLEQPLNREQTLTNVKITGIYIQYILEINQKFAQPAGNQYPIGIKQVFIAPVQENQLMTVLSKVDEYWTVSDKLESLSLSEEDKYISNSSSLADSISIPGEDESAEAVKKKFSYADITSTAKMAQQKLLAVFLTVYANKAEEMLKLLSPNLSVITITKEGEEKKEVERYQGSEAFLQEIQTFASTIQANEELTLSFKKPETEGDQTTTTFKFTVKNITKENDEYFITTSTGKQKWIFDQTNQVFTAVKIFNTEVKEKL